MKLQKIPLNIDLNFNMPQDLDKIDKNTLSAVGNVLAYLIYNEK